jgi:hypothetical protein
VIDKSDQIVEPMKTFAIFPVKNITLCVEGKAKEFTPEDQVGVVSTDGVSLMDLLGAIQFHHCKAVEIDEDQLLLDLSVDDEIEADETNETEQEPATEPETIEGESVDDLEPEDSTLDDQPESGIEDTAEFIPTPNNQSTVQKFIADGIDERVANSLVEQGLTPEDIGQLISEGFDLTEIEGIGKSRAAILRSLYGPVPPVE